MHADGLLWCGVNQFNHITSIRLKKRRREKCHGNTSFSISSPLFVSALMCSSGEMATEEEHEADVADGTCSLL